MAVLEQERDQDMPFIVWGEGDATAWSPWGFDTAEAAINFMMSGSIVCRQVLTRRMQLRAVDA